MNLFQKLGLVHGDDMSETQAKLEVKADEKETPIEKKPLFAEPTTISVPIIGVVDEKVYQLLSEAIERNNLPGNDLFGS
jgi:GTP-sensing pleiotropic transcriptional regulator CodY